MRTHQGRSGKRLNRRARLRPALHASRNVEGPGCCLAPALLAPGAPPFGTPLVLSLILPGRWSRPRESCMRPTSRSGQVFSPTKSPTTRQASHNNICAKVVRSGEARHARAANSAHPRAEPVLYAPRADPVGKSKQSKDDHFSSPRRQHYLNILHVRRSRLSIDAWLTTYLLHLLIIAVRHLHQSITSQRLVHPGQSSSSKQRLHLQQHASLRV